MSTETDFVNASLREVGSLRADNKRLRSEIVRLGRIFQRIAPQIGWRGFGPDANTYYCEFCQASHRDSDKIAHKKNCPILNVRATLNADAE